MLKRVGTEARTELESLLGRKIYLSLFVKVQPGWREHEAFLKELDWRAMLGAELPAATAGEQGPAAAGETGSSFEDGPAVFDAITPKPPPRKRPAGRAQTGPIMKAGRFAMKRFPFLLMLLVLLGLPLLAAFDQAEDDRIYDEVRRRLTNDPDVKVAPFSVTSRMALSPSGAKSPPRSSNRRPRDWQRRSRA